MHGGLRILALQLARDSQRLKALRQKLAQNRLNMPLFDTLRFARHIEAAYVQMWQMFCKGLPAHGFSVAAQAKTR